MASPESTGLSASLPRQTSPSGRCSASHWTDSKGKFWLFGGFGVDADQTPAELNDLWEFDPTTKEWTWMSGSNTVGANGGQPGVYGTHDSAAGGIVPGGRDSATAWIDKNDRL